MAISTAWWMPQPESPALPAAYIPPQQPQRAAAGAQPAPHEHQRWPQNVDHSGLGFRSLQTYLDTHRDSNICEIYHYGSKEGVQGQDPVWQLQSHLQTTQALFQVLKAAVGRFSADLSA
jgi:hypothetical protein